MKKIIVAAVSVALTLIAAMSSAVAQENRPGLNPLEVWACTFKDRKDQGDMNEVYEEIEAEGSVPYAAWQLDPYITGNFGQNVDFVYVGAWASGNEMGSDVASLLDGTYASSDAWNETVDCVSFLYTSISIQPNPSEEDDHYLVSIADCNADKGVSNGQAVNGIRRYKDWLVERGYDVGMNVWFPVHGGGDAEFDFKLVNVYAGPQAWGDAWQWRVNNQAVQARRNYMNGVVSCDDSRLYSTRTLMNSIN